MLLKLMGGAILTGAAFLCGCYFSKKLYKRRNFLRTFSAFLDSLSTDIRYTSEDIFTVVSRCSDFEELRFFNISDEMFVQPFDVVWTGCVSKIPKIYSLTNEDISLITGFGAKLGKTDVEGQLSHIEFYRKLIQKQITKAEEAIAQKSRLYRTMGLFCGAAAAIMMM